MSFSSKLPMAALALLMVGCSRTVIHEIRYTPSGEIKPGSELVLEVPVQTSQHVTYEWSSQDGGSFDNYNAERPLFKVPQKELIRISCRVTVGSEDPVRKDTVLQVRLDRTDAQPAAVPNAAAPDGLVAPPDAGNGSAEILAAGFVPSGWMGDGEAGRRYLSPVTNTPDPVHPHNQQWRYTPGPAGWVAVAYQFPANNWGSRPGRDWSARHFREITFWAKGVPTNNGPTVEFKAGNGTDPSKPKQDSFGTEDFTVKLTADWKQYRINLSQGPSAGANLSSVITGFLFTVRADGNPNPATFTIAEITYR
jgi:hypothetical protein